LGFPQQKRWYYFDHGIFTLHYFRSYYWFSYCSFLLIKSCLCFRNQVFLVFLQELLMDSVGWSIIFIRHTIALPWNTIDFLPEKQFSIFNQLYYNYHTFSPVYILYLYQSKITPKWKVLSYLCSRRHYHAVALKLPNQLIIWSYPFMNTITANELKHIFTL
jgi:hypothetical protein